MAATAATIGTVHDEVTSRRRRHDRWRCPDLASPRGLCRLRHRHRTLRAEWRQLAAPRPTAFSCRTSPPRGTSSGPRVGAFTNNLLHTWTPGLIILGLSALVGSPILQIAAGILIAHVGMDVRSDTDSSCRARSTTRISVAWGDRSRESRSRQNVPRRDRRRRPRASRGRRPGRGHDAGSRRARRCPGPVAVQAPPESGGADRRDRRGHRRRPRADARNNWPRRRSRAALRTAATAFRRFALANPHGYELVFMNLPPDARPPARPQRPRRGAAARDRPTPRRTRAGARGGPARHPHSPTGSSRWS